MSYIISPVSPLTSTLVAGNNNITGVATITANTVGIENLLQHTGALLGFFNATPTNQPDYIVPPAPDLAQIHAAVISILALLEGNGLMGSA